MNDTCIATEYRYYDSSRSHTSTYIWPEAFRVLEEAVQPVDRRVFEVGCGNGSFADVLTTRGYQVTGIDPSEAGIAIAHEAFPHLNVHQGSTYDDLAARFGQFPTVVSLEVVEHVYDPRKYAQCLYDVLSDGGTAIISTPYHGYWKNLALAASGKMDDHFTALRAHGHIKFWSKRSLSALLREAGFQSISFRRVGRIPPFAKSMIAIAKK